VLTLLLLLAVLPVVVLLVRALRGRTGAVDPTAVRSARAGKRAADQTVIMRQGGQGAGQGGTGGGMGF